MSLVQKRSRTNRREILHTPVRRHVFGVVAVGLAVALSLFGDMAVYVILPVYFVELGLTALQVGLLLSANR